jgi:dTDP-4-amino-4,6-dideoxygalactose transaminase
MTGAKPVFVDVSEETATMNPELLQRAHSARTKAIIPVHLYGQTADMAPIMGFARSHGLQVVEDAAQAHGAAYGGIKAGSIGDAGCFSFYPGKNLGAYGDAGAIVTDDFDLAERIRALRDHGQRERYHHTYVGWNGRMDGLQGKILSIKLKHLDGWNQHRRRVADHYGTLLPSEIFRTFATLDGNQHVYHLYVGRVRERDDLIEFLKNSGIQCGIHYPIPVHLQKAYEFLGHGKGSFPVSETLAHEILSIPMYPELDEAKVVYTCEKISMFYERQRIGFVGGLRREYNVPR